MSPLVTQPWFCNYQQLLWRKNNSSDGAWRTTGAAESARTAGEPLGIARGDRLILERCFLMGVRWQRWLGMMLLSCSAFSAFQQ